MKKIILLLIVVTLCFACQKQIDTEHEKESVISVIENETNSFHARDFDQQIKSFKQDEGLTILSASSNTYYNVIGWEEISKIYKQIHEDDPVPSKERIKFENYRIKVYQESALAYFDEQILSEEGKLLRKYINVRFLEKVDGECKIVYLSNVEPNTYD